jgi:hypothetical protein
MHFNRFLFRVAAVASLSLLGACATATRTPAPNAADVRIERVDKTFDLGHGIRRVAIDNPWGEINVRGRDEREVGIHAVIQRLPPRFAKASFRSHRDGDTLRVEVTFDGTPGAARKPGRIDIAVYVPTDLALVLSTRDSRIAAKNRIGAIEASTTSGEIHASSRSRLQLHTTSGQIRAIALGARWSGPSEISSDSGRIILLVPTFGDIALAAETSGRLTTNFGLSVHRSGARSWVRARYGQGVSVLHVQSGNGEIVLEQLVLLGDDKALPEDDD